MTRKEFLGTLGIGAAFALTSTCLGSCSKDKAAVPADIDFEIDLTDSSFEELLENGGYVIIDGVVVARSLSGEYIAATVVCSHQDFDDIIYQQGEWFCTRHGARFAEDTGEGLNANGSDGLFIYNTEQIGQTRVRVFS